MEWLLESMRRRSRRGPRCLIATRATTAGPSLDPGPPVQAKARGTGAASASDSRVEVVARDRSAPRPSDARCGVCHCTSSSRGSRRARRRAGRPGRPARPWRRRSPGGTSTRRRTAHRSRRRTARRRAGRRATPPRSAPSRAGAAPGRPPGSPGRSSPTARRGSAQRVDHLGERGVDPDLEPAGRAPQRPRDPQPVEGQHPAAYGREPHIGSPRRARRHREQAPPVRRQQRARAQVGAHRDQVVVGVEPPHSREPPGARRRLHSHRCTVASVPHGVTRRVGGDS